MGSVSFEIPDGSSARAEVARYVRKVSLDPVVASNSAPVDGDSQWSGVYFAAHKEGAQVYASITLFGQHQGCVHIKMMSESVWPTAHGVGRSVLAALTPLAEGTDSDSRQWRLEAEHFQGRRQAALAARGHWIRLARPVTLSVGEPVTEVEVVSMSRWRSLDGRLIKTRWDWFASEWAVIA